MAQGKKQQAQNWFALLAWMGLILVLGLISRATWNLYRKNQIAQDNLRSSAERAESLKERQATLQDKIAKLKTARGIEEEIRNNFLVAKEGEQVISIVEKKTEPVATVTPVIKPWWQIW